MCRERLKVFIFRSVNPDVTAAWTCGAGAECIEMAAKGAKRVIGIDIREDLLQIARQKALETGVENTCVFASSSNEQADTVVSLDTFENFADPADILRIMNTILKPEGEVLGGLNQMTIARFERLVASSPFKFAALEPIPIKKFQRIHNHLTREFTTAIVRCRLVKRT